MNKKLCKDLLKVTGDKCHYCKKGRFEIICEDLFGKYHYLKCNGCGETFEGI